MVHNAGIKSGSTATTTGLLSVRGPQPGWMTLDEASDRAFTGEIVFEVDPEVRVYLDTGVVYYAERASDLSLARRLLDAGVVDQVQLESGTVRVGDVEHLGRLFEREPSVDADAVMVATETSTEDLVTDLANHAVTTVRVTAYRHHPSGIHRWFASSAEPRGVGRQAGPTNHFAPSDAEQATGMVSDLIGDELVIEWDELADPTSPLEASSAFDVFMFDSYGYGAVDRDDVSIDFDGAESFDSADEEMAAVADLADVMEYIEPKVVDIIDASETAVTTEIAVTPEIDESSEIIDHGSILEPTVDVVDDADPDDFQLKWPNSDDEPVVVDVTGSGIDSAMGSSAPEPPPITGSGELRFEMPALELSDDDEAADEVPDEVAAAVRRAIAAIEMVSGEVPVISPMTAVFDPFAEVPEHVQRTAPSPVGFAPPTMAMRAEVMYAEEAAAVDAEYAVVDDQLSDVADEQGALEPAEAVADERASALRRLISSLRRKDH